MCEKTTGTVCGQEKTDGENNGITMELRGVWV